MSALLRPEGAGDEGLLGRHGVLGRLWCRRALLLDEEVDVEHAGVEPGREADQVAEAPR
jgi:hypothetical protein